MTASRPIGTIRGKNEVIRSRKPKERGNEPNRLAGMAAIRPTDMARK